MPDISTLKHGVVLVGVCFLSLLIPFFEFIHGLSYTYQLFPFVLSMVFLGLPHGAMDHLVPAELSSVSLPGSALRVGLLYAVLGGLYTAWWFIDAVTALLFFIVLTWIHWGQGDLHSIKELQRGQYAGGPLINFLYVVVRGGIPMLVPLIAHPELYARFISSVLSLFSTAQVIISFSGSIRLFTLLVMGSLTVISGMYHLAKATRQGSLRPWVYTQFETVLLWTYFLTLPPIFAVGVYFCVWHSLRHIARISLVKGGKMRDFLIRSDYLSYLSSVFSRATPLSIVSLACIVGIYFAFPSSLNTTESMIAVYLVCISILTLPHFAIVSWMDYKEKIWG